MLTILDSPKTMTLEEVHRDIHQALYVMIDMSEDTSNTGETAGKLVAYCDSHGEEQDKFYALAKKLRESHKTLLGSTIVE